jgi:hypothetical protein
MRIPRHDFQVGDRVSHRPYSSSHTPYKGLGTVVSINAPSGRFRGLVEIEWDTNRTKRTNQGWRTISLVSRAALNHGQPYFSYLGKYYVTGPEFKAGDRVRACLPSLFSPHTDVKYEGSVVQDFRPVSYADKVLIKRDDDDVSSFVDPSRLEKIAPVCTIISLQALQQSLNNMSNDLVNAYMPDKTPVQFHRNPKLRKWETSYTKRIIEELSTLEKITPWDAQKQSATKARNLLRRFWTDLHIPYEQRDAARAELEKARLENVSLREIIANAKRALEHKA